MIDRWTDLCLRVLFRSRTASSPFKASHLLLWQYSVLFLFWDTLRHTKTIIIIFWKVVAKYFDISIHRDEHYSIKLYIDLPTSSYSSWSRILFFSEMKNILQNMLTLLIINRKWRTKTVFMQACYRPAHSVFGTRLSHFVWGVSSDGCTWPYVQYWERPSYRTLAQHRTLSNHY